MASYASADYDMEAGTITVEFEDKSKITLSINEVPAAVQRQALFHGLKQKTVDTYAGAKKAVEDGEAIDCMSFAKEAVAGIWEQLRAGEWSSRREGAGRISMLAQAVAAVQGKPVEEIAAKLAAMDDEKKKAIAKHPKVALAIARLRKEAEARREAKLAEAAATAEAELVL